MYLVDFTIKSVATLLSNTFMKIRIKNNNSYLEELRDNIKRK